MILRLALASLIGFYAGRPSKTLGAEASDPPVRQAADGSVTLTATDAEIDGPNASLERDEKMSIAWWTNVDTSLRWTAAIGEPGKYRVELNFCVLGNSNRSGLAIEVGGQTARAILIPGNGINDFIWGEAGQITISKAGNIPVTMRAMSKAHPFVMYLRSIVLGPAGAPGHAIDITGSPIEPDGDGTFKLTAGEAEIDGMNAQLEGSDEKDIGFWGDVGTSLIWAIHAPKPGGYRVELNYSLPQGYDGSKLAIMVADQTVVAKPKAGGEWTDYKKGEAGEITIGKPGDYRVIAKPLSKPWGYLMNLRSVTLVPGEAPAGTVDISDKPVKQEPGGSLILAPAAAEVDGLAARIEGGERKYIAWWNSPERFIKWPIHVKKPGLFDILLTYSIESGSHSNIEIDIGDQKVAATFQSNGGLDNFKTGQVGRISIAEAGNLEVTLKSSEEVGHRVMDVARIKLVPVGGDGN